MNEKIRGAVPHINVFVVFFSGKATIISGSICCEKHRRDEIAHRRCFDCWLIE